MSLVALASPAGQKLLATANPRKGYDQVAPYWRRQVHRTACGLATAAVLLNALGCEKQKGEGDDGEKKSSQLHTEDTVAELVASSGAADVQQIRENGMTLETFEAVVEATGGDCNRFHADGISGEVAMRELLLRLLDCGGEEAAMVAVNYDMTTLGQVPFKGHFSPLVAYNTTEDRFLIMDVWPDTEPVWATAASLWESVNTTDADSGAKRGFASVALLCPAVL